MPNKRTQEPSEYKTVPFRALKFVEDEGIVEHLITVFGIEDLGGDVSHLGSFKKTLSERLPQIRVLDSHNCFSCMDAIGVPLELREIGRDELEAVAPEVINEHPEATGALWAKTQFLMETPEGRGIFTRLKSRAVSEFSYAYDALDVSFEDADEGRQVRHLHTIRLWEYSPVLWGMNQATTVLGVKDAKPVDETENTITVAVRDSDGFESDSFRVIRIGDEDEGIQARIGRLEGETTTTVQAYIFDKPKWDRSRAVAWVEEHGKFVVIVDVTTKEDPEQGEVPQVGSRVLAIRASLGMLDMFLSEVEAGELPTS